MADRGNNFFGKIYGGGGGGGVGGALSTWGTNDQIMPRRGFTNAFSSNLNTVDEKIFPNHGGI